ncbi:MAG: NAD-dependent epimerase/dehydratase family protein [Planctomycetales bacterium]|nr:NAD-dependent epimerase/dehydratase family protein [Planctomycetales bacterium]
MTRVAIFGASGFVGSTLAEELMADGVDVRCMIHSTGNAWRLARHGIDLKICDLMDIESIRTALSGCSHVVNCSRGKGNVMVDGFRNLLTACREIQPHRFVHISSVAVYGEVFDSDCISEDHPTRPEHGSYGWKKLQQDQMLMKEAQRGLPAVAICPPNISGPYSMFCDEICNNLRSGSFAFVDQGRFPCSLVDVGNLVQAIRLGLEADVVDGRRVFVCDQPTETWHRIATALARIVGVTEDIPNVSSDEAKRRVAALTAPSGSTRKTIGHLVSSEVRASLRKDPYIGKLEKLAVGWAKRLPAAIQDRLRDDVRHIKPAQNSNRSLSVRLMAQQIRNISYDNSLARDCLGYQPRIDFQSSIASFERFAELHWGLGSSPFQLLNAHS